jgi:hypothetical protein
MNGRVVLVTAVGNASGSKAAAAALACAGSDPDRPGLLIDVGGPPPRPALVASASARELEERLALHLPDARVASRGQTCHLAIAGDAAACVGIRAALPLARDSVTAIHLPPELLRPVVADIGLELTAVMLRADLVTDPALTALVAAELIAAGLIVRVQKRPLAWVPERRALFGVLPPSAAGGLSPRYLAGLLDVSSKPRPQRG